MDGANNRILRGRMSALRLGLLLPAVLLLAACDNSGPVRVTAPSGAGRSLASAGCEQCHADLLAKWTGSAHADTQLDVADELAEERAGETPEEVVHGADPEDCIACHGPTATAVLGTASESDALGGFFSTAGGIFTPSTSAINTGLWPHVSCFGCHEVTDSHPAVIPGISLFDSRTGQYRAMESASRLCGQCHGTLRFPDTDHVTYDTWFASSHNQTQQDVADELADERAGETPAEVVHGADAENCIACHGPTAVLADGGMNEEQALAFFFTSQGGQFTDSTAVANADQWPGVACTACHDPHDPSTPAYFNSETQEYMPVSNTSELCGKCHGTLRFPDTDHVIYDAWFVSSHNDTQLDVADELAEARAGETPAEVIHGDDPENCIACHGPTAVLADGGMTEVQALAHFFTSQAGQITPSTEAANASEWPGVGCTACHDPHEPATPAYFNSETQEYMPVSNTSELCGKCHGSLRFAGTDHLTYDAWSQSGHNDTQLDVAGELAEARAGETPAEVIHGADPENCIACHGPTAVLAEDGMTEEQALEYFFTTQGGTFTSSTVAANTSEWPGVACTACHDQHNPATPAYFNSETQEYTPVAESGELCGQCHGSLRFPDTDHRSYDILTGTGGIGVPDLETMPGVTCTDCHMFASTLEGSNSSMFHGHSMAITVEEEDGSSIASCTRCHREMDTEAANEKIEGFKSSFATLLATTEANVAAATQAMQGETDPVLLAMLDEAQRNLEYASFDESSGFHNHKYLMALLQDANDKALDLLAP